MFTVYVLRSLKDGWIYKGQTSDLARRLKQHNAGYTRSTRRHRPFEVAYSEEFTSREEAETREIYFKSGVGREELKRILCSVTTHPSPAGKSGNRG